MGEHGYSVKEVNALKNSVSNVIISNTNSWGNPCEANRHHSVSMVFVAVVLFISNISEWGSTMTRNDFPKMIQQNRCGFFAMALLAMSRDVGWLV